MGSNQTDVQVAVLPTVGRIVHFVASDTVIVAADGSKGPDVRPMLITGVFEVPEKGIVVNGSVFRQSLTDPRFIQPITELSGIEQDEADHKPRTWHWPKRK
jgi:hypothetical protein